MIKIPRQATVAVCCVLPMSSREVWKADFREDGLRGDGLRGDELRGDQLLGDDA